MSFGSLNAVFYSGIASESLDAISPFAEESMLEEGAILNLEKDAILDSQSDAILGFGERSILDFGILCFNTSQKQERTEAVLATAAPTPSSTHFDYKLEI